jgi:hypothetical protein
MIRCIKPWRRLRPYAKTSIVEVSEMVKGENALALTRTSRWVCCVRVVLVWFRVSGLGLWLCCVRVVLVWLMRQTWWIRRETSRAELLQWNRGF